MLNAVEAMMPKPPAVVATSPGSRPTAVQGCEAEHGPEVGSGLGSEIGCVASCPGPVVQPVIPEAGGLKLGVLEMSYTSARNCSVILSGIGKFLRSEKSGRRVCGPKNWMLPSFPGVPAG